MRLIFFLLLSTQFLISCGGAGSDDGSQKQSQEDNERRKAAYNRVKGVYRGILETREAQPFPIEIELVLYTYDIIEEKPDPNGDPLIRTVLLGQFRAINTVGEIDDINLATAYDTKTGIITMNSSDMKVENCPVGPKDVVAMQGSLLNREFVGSIRRNATTWGTMRLRQSGEVVGEPIIDQKQRLEKFLTPLVGEYRGPFVSTNGREDFPVRIDLRIENVKMDFGSDFIYCPDLRGTYIRPDLSPGTGTMIIRGLYRHSEASLQIESIRGGLRMGTMSAPVGTGDFQLFAPIPGYDVLNIHSLVERTLEPNGSFIIHGFSGDMNWWTYKGHLNMKKVK